MTLEGNHDKDRLGSFNESSLMIQGKIRMRKRKKTKSKEKHSSAKAAAKGGCKLYTLEVFLIDHWRTRTFLKRKKKDAISRTIQIREDQTLAMFHDCVFDAFDRSDEHMYEFQVGGRGPMDRNARLYVLPSTLEGPFGNRDQVAGVVTKATIGVLGLEVGDSLGYWFDFGDDWWHQVNVVSIDMGATSGTYPRVIARQGDSPPQYPDYDEEEDCLDEEDDLEDEDDDALVNDCESIRFVRLPSEVGDSLDLVFEDLVSPEEMDLKTFLAEVLPSGHLSYYYRDAVERYCLELREDATEDQLELLRRTIGMPEVQIRKKAYQVGLRLFGRTFIEPALDDRAKSIRDWAKMRLDANQGELF